MPQIVGTARPDGYVRLLHNERWYEYTGLRRDDFGDASWEAILHPEDMLRTRETYYSAIDSGQPYNIEYRLMDRYRNRWRWFVGRAIPVRDAESRIVKWFGTCTDIDEQKQVQEELRRANADLEQFAFSASHDLQEPLRSVKIYSELLAERLGDTVNEDARVFITYMRNGATRMEMLVRDLLTYTQVTKFEPPGETTDANETLNSALANLASAISESGAEISADRVAFASGAWDAPAANIPKPHRKRHKVPQPGTIAHHTCRSRAAERQVDIHHKRQRHRHRPPV